MREMTSAERALLTRREAGFEEFYDELLPVLVDFMEAIELPEPALVLNDASRYLPALEEWMRFQNVGDDDRVWTIQRIGYFAGEYLVQRWGGAWMVMANPESPLFARYVVGEFRMAANQKVVIDVFGLAAEYVSQPPGRSLRAYLDEAEKALGGVGTA